MPLWQSLETVHHRSIVTVGSRSEHSEHQTDVKLSQVRVFVPGDSGELLSTDLEGLLACRVERHREGVSQMCCSEMQKEEMFLDWISKRERLSFSHIYSPSLVHCSSVTPPVHTERARVFRIYPESRLSQGG